MKRSELLKAYIASNPETSFTVSAVIDEDSTWDGDGADPVEYGFSPFIVTVTASRISKGQLIEGHSHLGSSYVEEASDFNDPNKLIDFEIHGYFPQMLQEAFQELTTQLAA